MSEGQWQVEEEETELRLDKGRQTYVAAKWQKNKLADDSPSWNELTLCSSHSPSTSSSIPGHLSCPQSNLNVCFSAASLAKNYTWRCFKSRWWGMRKKQITKGRKKRSRGVLRKMGVILERWWWLDILFTTTGTAVAAVAIGHHDSACRAAYITLRLSKHPWPLRAS